MTPTTDQAAREAAEKTHHWTQGTPLNVRTEFFQEVIAAALAEKEAECERLKREKQAVERDWGELFLLKNTLSKERDTLATEAERLRGELKEARRENECHIEEMASVKAENAALREQVEKMDKALQFYANAESWTSHSTGFAAQYDPEPSPIEQDRGETARAARGERE